MRTTVRLCNAMHWLITLKKICVGSRRRACRVLFALFAVALPFVALTLSHCLCLSLSRIAFPPLCLSLWGAKKQLLNVYLFACRRLRRLCCCCCSQDDSLSEIGRLYVSIVCALSSPCTTQFLSQFAHLACLRQPTCSLLLHITPSSSPPPCVTPLLQAAATSTFMAFKLFPKRCAMTLHLAPAFPL